MATSRLSISEVQCTVPVGHDQIGQSGLLEELHKERTSESCSTAAPRVIRHRGVRPLAWNLTPLVSTKRSAEMP